VWRIYWTLFLVYGATSFEAILQPAFWQYNSSICSNNQWKKEIPIADLIKNTIRIIYI
jgi:hypothetical protein